MCTRKLYVNNEFLKGFLSDCLLYRGGKYTDFKKLFKNKSGVSPVLGVIMMLAITAILVAIGVSSVANMEPNSSLSGVSIGIAANSTATDTAPASVKLEHLDGAPIEFGDSTLTKVTASLNGGETVIINATCINTLSIGDVRILPLTSDGTTNAFGKGPVSGDTATIKIIDLKANQIISDSDVMF